MTNSAPYQISNEERIPYTVRFSRRARHARLKLSPHEGLVVVLPPGFDRRRVPELVESRREWIEKVCSGFERRRIEGISDGGPALPSAVFLPGIGEEWRVSFVPGDADSLSVREVYGDEVRLAGAVHDHALVRRSLFAWLRKRAEARLAPELMTLASIHGFAVSRVSFRVQRSRWGSCSSKGTISLNLKLLFLPPPLVRYIMVHELCHTRHMNHSPRYWSEVARIDPDYLHHDREMRHAWRYVPSWAAVNS